MAVAAVVAGLALTTGPVAAAPAPTPSGGAEPAVPQVTPQRRAIELVQPSLTMIRTDWTAFVDIGEGSPIPRRWSSVCSGFIVSTDGYVATAGHCTDSEEARREAVEMIVDEAIEEGAIEQSSRADVVEAATSGRDRWLVFGKDRDSPPTVEVQVQLGGGVASWPAKKDPKDGVGARVIETVPFDKGDVALLKVQENDLPVAKLATRDQAQVGQELISIGYPFEQADGDEVAPTNQNGQINSVDTTGSHGPGNLFYQTSAALSRGMSGGPTAALDGQVLGLGSNTRLNKSNFIVPASVIAEVLARHQVTNELGRVDALYRTGLDDFYRGYYSDAIKSFEQVQAITPTHQMAKQKVREAADLRQRHGDQARPAPPKPVADNRMLMWGATGGGAVLLLGLALAAVLLVRRRRKAAVASPYGPGGADVDPRAGYGPVYRAGEFPSTYPGDPASGPPAYGSPAYGPPVTARYSAPPTSAVPSSGTPWNTPPAGSPPGGVPTSPGPSTFEPDRTEVLTPPVSPGQPAAGAFCQQCGAPRGAGAAFCSNCGTRLGMPTTWPS